MHLSKEELRELYKERDEALFFDYKPIKARHNFIKFNKVMLDKTPEVFNHYITLRFFPFLKSYHKGSYEKVKALNNLGKERWTSKQVVIKKLSNLDRNGAKNALSYVIRNSNTDFALNQDGEFKNLAQIMRAWSKDFTDKKNAKEVLHLCFSIKEDLDENGRIERILKNAVNDVMRKNFFLYKYVLVLHTHQSNPHIHVLINKNNIMDGQKFHLNNAEFKPFFNQLRNDFAQSLNAQGLNYHNHYKLENDLAKIQKEIVQNNFLSKLNVLDDLNQLQVKVKKKIKALKNKIYELEENLKKDFALQDELRHNLGELKRQMQVAKDMRIFNKEFGKAFHHNLDNLSSLNEIITQRFTQLKMLRKDLNILEQDSHKFDFQKLALKHEQEQEFSNLIQKKRYLEFITTHIDRKTLTKSEINLKIKAIQQDIFLSEANASFMVKENIKASLLTNSLLGQDNNAFALTRAYKELEKNLFMLKECKQFIKDDVWADDETRQTKIFDKFEQRLESNQDVILDLINQRFLLLQKEIELKKKNNTLKHYQVKEYEKASAFLNKNNREEIEALFKLVGETNSPQNKASSHTQSGGKAQEQANENTQNKQEIQTKSEALKQSLQEQQNAQETQNNKPSKESQESKKNTQQKIILQSSGFTVRR